MHTKQKILFVITKGNWGGAQKYVYEIATRLSKEEFDIVVVHGWGDILPTKLAAHGIRTHFIPELGRDINIGKDNTAFFTLIKLFRQEKPDIVHLNSSKIGGLGALAARLVRIPKIVFTVHGFAFNEKRTFFQKKLITWLSWITLVLCTDVICISKQEFTTASHWLFMHHKLRLIYNGIPATSVEKKEDARKKISAVINQPEDIFKNKTVIGSIGELTENKGYSYALGALKDIENILYIIIGTGEHHQVLQQKIIETRCMHKIFLAGFIENASSLLPAFDMFLVPSLKEGIPYVVLEAGNAQVPVITTPVGGIPEVVQDSVSGFFITAESSNSIQQKIQALLYSPDKLKSAAARLHADVRSHFSIDMMISKTRSLYKNNVV